MHEAEADRLRAESSALRAQTAYEARKRDIELRLAEQKAAADLQAREERLAKLVEPLAIAGAVVGSVAALTLTATISYYLIMKARAADGHVAGRAQPVQRSVVPSASQMKQGKPTEGSQASIFIDRAKVSPYDITYDGFLAHFHDYVLYPNYEPVFYHTEIAPEVEDLDLAILSEVQIISWETNGRTRWVLRRQIRGIKDVRRRVFPACFLQPGKRVPSSRNGTANAVS